MAEFLFWEPYNKAKLYADFRDLIKAIEDNDPMALHWDVLKLLAEQVDEPRSSSRTTALRDSFIWVERIKDAMRHDGGKPRGKLERAMKSVMDKHPNKTRDALIDHWKLYKAAKEKHDQID